MNKEQKVNYVKCWLQKFGNRDNETFNIQLEKWRISMQYDYDLEGYRIIPMNWCCSSFKHVHNNSLEDRTEDELTEIIKILFSIKKIY